MKPSLFALAIAPFFLAGCCAYSRIAEIKPASDLRVDGNAKPLASFVVCNHSYKLLGCIPLSSGVTWKGEGPLDGFNLKWFSDHCTIDENLASVKAAAEQCGTDRVCGLVTTEDSFLLWSLFLVKHTELKTSCLICEPADR